MKRQDGFAITGILLAIVAVVLIAIVMYIYLNRSGVAGDSTAYLVSRA